MPERFDPYYRWLAIPPDEQPPNHYRLLGLRLFEDNADVVEAAADRQMRHLRTYQTGKHGELSQKLLNEVAAARLRLLNPPKKAAYDATLRSELPAAAVAGPAAAEEADGAVFGEYLLLDLLGKGGTGQVFKARHRALGRVVALKVLSPQATQSPEVVARFRRKIKIMAGFDHPNLVAAFDAGCRDGVHFLVMGYVDGDDLNSLCKRFHPLPIPYVVSYVTQAASALGYAHARGVYHRNVKPGNILVDQQGIVKVIGLGLARTDVAEDAGPDGELTAAGVTLGTPDYMAPEQFGNSKSADPRADVYSLGCTLYAVLTAAVPYPVKGSMKKLLAHRKAPVPSLRQARADAPASLDRVLQTMMAKAPGDRYPSMDEVIAALRAIEPDLLQPAPPVQQAAANPQLEQFLGWVAEHERRQSHR